MAWADQDAERGQLMREVWSGTPWMVDAFTGPISNGDRYAEIMEWCRENFGPEASPLHGRQGNWHSGGATIYGWTWMGFATEEMAQKFLDKWSSADQPTQPPAHLADHKD